MVPKLLDAELALNFKDTLKVLPMYIEITVLQQMLQVIQFWKVIFLFLRDASFEPDRLGLDRLHSGFWMRFPASLLTGQHLRDVKLCQLLVSAAVLLGLTWLFSTVVNTWGSEPLQCRGKSQLYHLLVLWPSVSPLMFLTFGFLSLKMRKMNPCLGVLCKWDNRCELPRMAKCSGTGRCCTDVRTLWGHNF